MNIYLLRHGRTTRPGCYNGRSNVDLSREGKRQVEALTGYLGSIDFDVCYSSPLLRCRSTVEQLHLACRCIEIEALREIDFGDWEGRTFAEIAESEQDKLDRWNREQDRFTFPGGESIARFAERVGTWCAGLLDGGDGNVLVVSHAGVIRQAVGFLLDLEPRQLFRVTVDEAGLAVIVNENGYSRLYTLLNGEFPWRN